ARVDLSQCWASALRYASLVDMVNYGLGRTRLGFRSWPVLLTLASRAASPKQPGEDAPRRGGPRHPLGGYCPKGTHPSESRQRVTLLALRCCSNVAGVRSAAEHRRGWRE